MLNKIKIVTDACCHIAHAHKKGRNGWGYCACGILIVDEDDNEIARYGKYLGEKTVPESEYNAVILALEKASSYCRNEIEIWSDSQLVIRQLNKIYRLNAENLKLLHDRIVTLEGRYNIVKYFHHLRTAPLARIADEIAQEYYEKNFPGV